MRLTLTRTQKFARATIGELAIEGQFECFTLEDVIRSMKVKGKTAIPEGSYPVSLTESPRFSDRYEKRGLGRIVPLIESVPGFVGVRIHVGNTAEHTDGCILVGTSWDGKSPRIGGSVDAFKKLMTMLAGGSARTRISIRNQVSDSASQTAHPGHGVWSLLYAPASSEGSSTLA